MEPHRHCWEKTVSDYARKCECGAVKAWMKDHWEIVHRQIKPRRPKRVVVKNCVMF